MRGAELRDSGGTPGQPGAGGGGGVPGLGAGLGPGGVPPTVPGFGLNLRAGPVGAPVPAKPKAPMPKSAAADLVKAGKLAEALTTLQNEIKQKPENAYLRVFLFQLLAVMGQWERAATQMAVAAQMDAENLLMAQVCRGAIECERFRAEVFAGKRLPLVLGEPEEWVGMLVHANQLTGQGQHAAGAELRTKALEAAPAIGGTIRTVAGAPDDEGAEPETATAFEWLADADSRLGPVLEALIDGKYYWVPMNRVRSILIERPADLRDVVWLPATITLTAGGAQMALLPVRYPGTDARGTDAMKLSRTTEFEQLGAGEEYAGLGQRLLATDAGEFGLLETRSVTFNA
jgi:type VI secretion system protein ImpE